MKEGYEGMEENSAGLHGRMSKVERAPHICCAFQMQLNNWFERYGTTDLDPASTTSILKHALLSSKESWRQRHAERVRLSKAYRSTDSLRTAGASSAIRII